MQRALHLVWANNIKFEKAIDWTKVNEWVPVVQAVTEVRIFVNSVALTGSHDCIKFGWLHIGDIITLMHDIQFCCEFFYGASLQSRTTTFMVESYAAK